MQEIDQKAAIMIVIEQLGNVPAGTRCSAMLFDAERIRREKEFHAKLYRKNGVEDQEVIQQMVRENVREEPYWLVSLKFGDLANQNASSLYRVDAQTGKVLDEPKNQWMGDE